MRRIKDDWGSKAFLGDPGAVMVNRDLILIETIRGMPDGIKLFDAHINPSGSMIFFLDYGHERSSIVVAPGDDPVGRFHKLLEEAIMAREIGMKKGASAKVKNPNLKAVKMPKKEE